MSVVKADFGGRPFRQLGEMYEELRLAIRKYDLEVPLAGTIGVLEIIKMDLVREAREDG